MADPLVIDTEQLAPGPRAWLAERAEVRSCPVDSPEFPGLLARARGLVIRTYTRIDGALLDRAPRLKVIGRAGVGLDHIDLGACRARGVTVVSTPEANASSVAELVFGLLLDTLRPRPRLTRALDGESWVRARSEHMGRRELNGLTLGVWGMGRVGRRVATIGRAFEMRVVYHDLLEIPEADRQGAAPAAVAQLVETADVVSVHVDGRAANRHLVNAKVLVRMKPDAILVNASRGFVVDTEALAAHLRSHEDARALLDVHDPEPFPPDYPLLSLTNAILVPHLGAATIPAKDRMGAVVEDVWRVLEGRPPIWPAN